MEIRTTGEGVQAREQNGDVWCTLMSKLGNSGPI